MFSNPVFLNIQPMQSALLILLGILVATVITAIILTVKAVKYRRIPAIVLILVYLVAVLTLACCFYCHNVYQNSLTSKDMPADDFTPTQPTTTEATAIPEETIPTEAETEPITEPTTEPEPEIVFAPCKTEASDPANWDINWQILPADGSDSYVSETEVVFGEPDNYYPMAGVTTFRGNNHRTGSSYGSVEITEEKLSVAKKHGVTVLFLMESKNKTCIF